MPVTTPQDTIPAATTDSVALAAPKGAIATTIKYSATDSIVLEADQKIAHLYGKAQIEYGQIKLEAAYIQINYETNVLSAKPVIDSTGNEVGVPVFTDAGQSFAAKDIAYNFKSKRGRIANVVTQQGEGYIHAEVVKRNEQNEFFGLHARYTTCDLEHPHFFINATKIKAIPDSKVMSGPFNLVIGDIPLPVGFLFGLFPTPKEKRASGVIIPTFGENRARGFFLSGGGYYFALNDYVDAKITGDVYSLGGYKADLSSTYFKRYSYQGGFGFSYDYFKNDEADIERTREAGAGIPLPPTTRSIWINWRHSPVQKPGRGRFSASVNAGSSLYNRINYVSTARYQAPTLNSSISYQKVIQNTPFSYSTALTFGQQNGGNVYNFNPTANLSMTQMSLYELLTNNTPTGRWYEKFTFGYGVNFQNQISNIVNARPNVVTARLPDGRSIQINVAGAADTSRTIPVDFNNIGELWRNGRWSAAHNFSIGLGNYKVLRHFNLTPSLSYAENWSGQRFSYTYNPDANTVSVDTAGFGRTYTYSGGASLSTTIYGTLPIKGNKVEAIRHVMRPTIGYSFSPNYLGDSFNYFQTTQVGVVEGTNQPIIGRLLRYPNAPQGGLQSAMTFGVTNNVEMKVKSKTDTTGAKAFEKVSLIDNLSASSSYNFAADSFKLANINLNMNTRLFKIINVNFNSTLNPYRVNAEGRPIDSYTFPRVVSAGLSAGLSLTPESFGSSETAAPTNIPALEHDQTPMLPSYVDFKIPWTLSTNFSLYYTRFSPLVEGQLVKALDMSGSLNLTDKWKIQLSTGYDFTNKNISMGNINIHRDLHCWDMSISWIPFGFARGYNLTINARSSLLQDLKLTRNRSGWNR
ncbi:putative LPS assembly protein LptD [Botryobacter ruber]|uniref:putative LPS assembly protein LptD n=1 Tax=Botryobacter ruber TaxID=2171629 RepID=UPI000F64EDCA|nr:putative LPS assembly protein LptD [Botryobacter ruber]